MNGNGCTVKVKPTIPWPKGAKDLYVVFYQSTSFGWGNYAGIIFSILHEIIIPVLC